MSHRSQFAHRQVPAIVIKVSVEPLETRILDVPNLIADGSDQVLVVRNNYHSTLVVVQCDDQSIDCIDIKMIGGLI